MTTLLNRFKLSAKLPLLGPLIGATVPAGARLEARLWIQVDDTQDEPPLLALSALWDPEAKRVCADSAQLWTLTVALPGDTDPQPRLHFALARVEFPLAAAHCVMRVVSLHRQAGTDQGAHYPPMICNIADAASAGKSPVEPTEAFPHGDFRDLKGKLDELAGEAFAEIEGRLAKTALEVRKPIRKTRSRWALNLRSIRECEADLAAGARNQLAKGDGELVFAATCCQHPGVGWDSERAERSYATLGDESRDAAGPAFALLTGDQIYADATAGAFDIDDRFEKYSVRYEEAFGAPRFRRCAAGLPLYMAADDHEVEDGWSRARLMEAQVPPHQLRRRVRLANWARMLFIAYQRLHGPSSPDLKRGWYDFKAAGVPFFVMDTRFERRAWDGKAAPRICDAAQFAKLFEWLEKMQALDEKGSPLAGVPKFIVSGSVLAPGLQEFVRDPDSARRADTWQAFAGERAELLAEIARLGLRNVVFLSGDYHCGAVAALALEPPARAGEGQLAAYAIVSPPAYAPFPFANVRAGEVATEELVSGPPYASVEAKAVEGEGYAEIRVARRGGDWSVEVSFTDLRVDDAGSRPCRSYRLAGGRILQS